MLEEQQRVRWITSHRFAPFVAEARGDEALAHELYAWHAELAGTLFRGFHHFEVLVRNVIDDRLGEGQPQAPLRATWLTDFGLLQPNAIKQVIDTIERLQGDRKQRGREITRGRVVAGVSFGFWAGLFAKGYEELWRQHLRVAFQEPTLQRGDLTQPMRELQTFRNRIAHHDCLLAQPVEARYRQMLTISSWIDPAARDWIEARSNVAGILAERPNVPAID